MRNIHLQLATTQVIKSMPPYKNSKDSSECISRWTAHVLLKYEHRRTWRRYQLVQQIIAGLPQCHVLWVKQNFDSFIMAQGHRNDVPPSYSTSNIAMTIEAIIPDSPNYRESKPQSSHHHNHRTSHALSSHCHDDDYSSHEAKDYTNTVHVARFPVPSTKHCPICIADSHDLVDCHKYINHCLCIRNIRHKYVGAYVVQLSTIPTFDLEDATTDLATLRQDPPASKFSITLAPDKRISVRDRREPRRINAVQLQTITSIRLSSPFILHSIAATTDTGMTSITPAEHTIQHTLTRSKPLRLPTWPRSARECCDGLPCAAPQLHHADLETYASCIDLPCMRFFFSIAASINYFVLLTDAVNAYANANGPSIPTYIRVDDAFIAWYLARFNTQLHRGMVTRALHALQGHPEAGSTVSICRQVDDLAIVAPSIEIGQRLISAIGSHVQLIANSILTKFNSVRVKQYIRLHCPDYIDRLVDDRHFWSTPSLHDGTFDTKEHMSLSIVKTIDSEIGPPKHSPEGPAIVKQSAFAYRHLLGALIYAYVVSCIDIGFVLTKLSQYSQHSAAIHFTALK